MDHITDGHWLQSLKLFVRNFTLFRSPENHRRRGAETKILQMDCRVVSIVLDITERRRK